MDTPDTIAKGDIIQIDPAHDERFEGCLLIVTEVKSWGVQAVALIPSADGVQHAYYRAPWGRFARCGAAVWALG